MAAALATDPVLLARFSALTYNGHRIHYDTPYATGVEGYPDLVIHGPLLALLALELPRRHAPDATVAEFAYRLVRPAFLPVADRRGGLARRRCGRVRRGRRGRRAVAHRHRPLPVSVPFGVAASR